MESHQILSLAVMQVLLLPAAYSLWALGAATWTTFASNRRHAAASRARGDDAAFAHSRSSFVPVWIGLNAGLVALMGGF